MRQACRGCPASPHASREEALDGEPERIPDVQPRDNAVQGIRGEKQRGGERRGGCHCGRGPAPAGPRSDQTNCRGQDGPHGRQLRPEGERDPGGQRCELSPSGCLPVRLPLMPAQPHADQKDACQERPIDRRVDVGNGSALQCEGVQKKQGPKPDRRPVCPVTRQGMEAAEPDPAQHKCAKEAQRARLDFTPSKNAEPRREGIDVKRGMEECRQVRRKLSPVVHGQPRPRRSFGCDREIDVVQMKGLARGGCQKRLLPAARPQPAPAAASGSPRQAPCSPPERISGFPGRGLNQPRHKCAPDSMFLPLFARTSPNRIAAASRLRRGLAGRFGWKRGGRDRQLLRFPGAPASGGPARGAVPAPVCS